MLASVQDQSPTQLQTSANGGHTCLSVLRLVTITDPPQFSSMMSPSEG
jgi:hypothetical protein